jgi:ribonucleoside-diphosphate reductase alpha chain
MKKESELKERRAGSSGRGGQQAGGHASRQHPPKPAQARTQPPSGFAPPLSLRRAAEGLKIERFFTRPGVDPFDEVEWETRNAVIGNEKGQVVFEQKDVEVPRFWSQTATNVVASKYFRGTLGTPERERSVKQLIGRVVRTIAGWGRAQGYFDSEADAQAFEAELKHLLVYQKMSFNSPVWFNIGIESRPQSSACQPYHARVMTASGPMPIGEIVEKRLIGLPVFDSQALTQVVAVKRNGRKPVYRIELRDGFSVEATGDHYVCAHNVRRTMTVEWRRVDTLTKGMVMRVYPHAAETVTPPGDPREVAEAALAGWLQADGFVGRYEDGTNRSLTIEFMTNGAEEHKWVLDHLQTVFPDVHSKVTDVETKDTAQKVRRVRLYGEVLRPFVEKYDLLRRGTEIRVPRAIFAASNDAVAAYLKSVFQADGYASLHGDTSAHIALAVIARDWVRDLQVLLTRFGIYSRYRRKEEKREDRHDTWELDISISSERQQFAETIGFVSERKNLTLRQSLQRDGKLCPEVRFAEIEAIVPLGEQEVYDIQTGSGVYLSEGVLVHNCFINSVEDTMESILGLARTEGMLFKYGSGTGTNLSPIRSSKELLAGGGTASGPVSFMKGYDAFAGVIKSGGKTRRAAKMVILNIDHPDIEEFINCKKEEERKAWALIDAGYSPALDGPAYSSIFFQNSNNSVRVTDEFMKAVESDGEWQTRAVTSGEPVDTYRARDLMKMIADAAWHCGDPGMQFDTTINDWHTVPKTGRINASNPCSEYMHLDDSACNLASLNLMKLVKEDGELDVPAYKKAIETTILAQEIIVDNASYPTQRIAQNSHDYRPLGLGYANLGALLMSRGLAYDSDAGRDYAGAITSVLTGQGYVMSARVAEKMGPFNGFEKNREPFLRVIKKHGAQTARIDSAHVPLDLYTAARDCWEEAHELGEKHGIRNSQATVIAPTGTIAFMMDCDTTGIEPDIALIKYKKLVGGGLLKIVNQTVPRALERLGYSENEVKEIMEYVEENETIEGAPHLKDAHLPVFDCAFRPLRGSRSIQYMGHLRMMAAAQPFISGAISKTVNVPSDVTVDEIMEAYMQSWKLGLKAVAIYRDGCKRSQPLSTSKDQAKGKTDAITPAAAAAAAVAEGPARAVRRRLPVERRAITHKFSIAGHDGYITVGMYEDGTAGEIFLVMAKEGSVVSGLMDSFATAVSMALQYGVPLQVLVDKFSHVRFEPSGFTNNPEIPIAKSIVDYIFRWLASKFLSRDAQQAIGIHVKDEGPAAPTLTNGSKLGALGPAPIAGGPLPVSLVPGPGGPAASDRGPTGPHSVGAAANDTSRAPFAFHPDEDAPPCPDCGSIMVRNAACYKCLNCGATSGCS